MKYRNRHNRKYPLPMPIRIPGRLRRILPAVMLWGLIAQPAPAAQRPTPGPEAPNVVLIVMDTVRPDRLSCYGYPRPTTPNLDKLLSESCRYTRAYSTSCWTIPAHASLFTGLYPRTHKATQENVVLSRSLTTLAEILQDHGYSTIAITENPTLNKERNFDQGFDRFHETWKIDGGEEAAGGGGVNPAIARFKEAVSSPGPFFIFVNLIEPHSPYDSSGDMKETFLTDSSIPLTKNMFVSYYLGWKSFTPAEFRHLNQLYDAELLYVDHLIGRMIRILKETGVWDKTIFIVTSDHGENIGDHGHMDHIFSLNETLTKIPLIIRHPEKFPPGTRDDRPVQLVDILPTLLNLLDIKSATVPLPGHDLSRPAEDPDRPIICEYGYPREVLYCFPKKNRGSARLRKYLRPLRSITRGDMKLIRSGDGRHELYDLKKDPGETKNLIDADGYGSVREKLMQEIEEFGSSPPPDQTPLGPIPSTTPFLDPKTRRELRSLGYLR